MSRRQVDDHSESLLERASHDLLNPVSAILGLAETIRVRGTDLPDETLRQIAGSIARQAAVLETSLRDLARATRLQREDPAATLADVVLNEVAAEVAAERVRIEGLDGVAARADAHLLSAALARLVANALEQSTAEVLVRVGRSDGRAWIEVADSGVGFTAEGLAASFAPLAAGTNIRGERGPGLGLGLYVAKRLVEAQGGTLEASSEEGKGSRFRIVLPD